MVRGAHHMAIRVIASVRAVGVLKGYEPLLTFLRSRSTDNLCIDSHPDGNRLGQESKPPHKSHTVGVDGKNGMRRRRTRFQDAKQNVAVPQLTAFAVSARFIYGRTVGKLRLSPAVKFAIFFAFICASALEPW